MEDIALRAEAQREVRQQQYEETIAVGMEPKVLAEIMLGEATAGTSAAEEEDSEDEEEEDNEEDVYKVGRCRLSHEAYYVLPARQKMINYVNAALAPLQRGSQHHARLYSGERADLPLLR